MKKVNLFGLDILVANMEQTVQLVEERIHTKKPTHLLGVNADKINEMGSDKKFDDIVKNAEIINADGASVVIASRFLRQPLPERVSGIDLMQELLKVSEEKNFSVYFLGAKQEIVSKMVKNFAMEYPNLNVSGYRNGYFERDDWENIANEIKQRNPDIIFVGITSPIKEYLIDFLMKQDINSIFMGVGGSFDVLSGKIKRAPVWMQKTSLEWLFRVLQEPRRLFNRYFLGNTKFMLTVVKAKLRGK